jgi:HK97 family phage portal protein
MALFDFLRKRADETEGTTSTPTVTETEKEMPVNDVLLKALLSGQPITRAEAMTVPAVCAAVDFISNTIASMPVKLYRYAESSHTIKEMKNDTRVELLNGDTGDTLDAFQMKKAFVMDYLMSGNGYLYIRRFRNEATGLVYVPTDYVAPQILNPNPLNKQWRLFVYDKQFELFEFVKLLRNTQDGATGTGLTEEVAKALQTAYATLVYQLTSLQNGGNKKGFLKSERKLDQTAINALQVAWRKLYTPGSENMMVLNNGLEFQEASNSATEMQLDQNKKTLTDEIKNIFHIYDNDYYRTFKEAIYPIIKAFETALNRDLLLEREKKSYYFEFDVKEILRVDIKERYEAYRVAKEAGFITINEIREAENMERIEGMDVVNVGLASVLYDVNTHKYYTPNVDKVTDPNDSNQGTDAPTPGGDEATQKETKKLDQEIVDREAYDEAKEEGNVE